MQQSKEPAMQHLIDFSPTIIKAEIVELGPEMNDEDGVIEQAVLFKIGYVYKGDLTASTYATIFFKRLNYLKDADGDMATEKLPTQLGLNYILFLRPSNVKHTFNLVDRETPSFELCDKWLGILSFNEYLHKYIIAELSKAKKQ